MAAAIRGSDISVLSASDAAIGIKATMVPTLVPMQSDTTHAEMNNPANRKLAGRSCNVRFTVASTAPIAFADEAKAPASTNIHTISSRSFCPAPLLNSAIRSRNDIPRESRMAMMDMEMKMSNIL